MAKNEQQAEAIRRNREEGILIQNFHETRHDESGKRTAVLLDFMLEKVRTMNDTAPMDKFQYNQGQIAVLKQLREYLERGLPVFPKIDSAKSE